MIPPSTAPPEYPHVLFNDSKSQGTRRPLAYAMAAPANNFTRRATAHSTSVNLARRAPARRSELTIALDGERTCGASTLWPVRGKVISRHGSSTRRPAPLTAPTHRRPQLDWRGHFAVSSHLPHPRRASHGELPGSRRGRLSPSGVDASLNCERWKPMSRLVPPCSRSREGSSGDPLVRTVFFGTSLGARRVKKRPVRDRSRPPRPASRTHRASISMST
ncbi:MAG: hypothetical protein K0S37_4401 [Microbacterium sp.]|nr:hypothetical protein [Microbacterium sp.]